MTDIPLLSQLESYLSLTNKRETVIASNMANVDTPGYHTKDIDFQKELSRAMSSSSGASAPVQVTTVNGLMERPDGNNVDMDRESVLLSEAQLQYQAEDNMSIFNALNISASALTAERQRSEVAASNLANVDTTRADGSTGPYRRREVVLQSTGSQTQFLSMLNSGSATPAGTAGGVRLTSVMDDKTDPIRRYDPGNSDADKDGYVAYPAVNPTQEMVDLMGSVRSYQLNASAITASKQMIQQSIDILKS